MNYHIITEQDYNALQEIVSVLYSDKKLTGDDRRDLANCARSILWRAVEVSEDDLENI